MYDCCKRRLGGCHGKGMVGGIKQDYDVMQIASIAPFMSLVYAFYGHHGSNM